MENTAIPTMHVEGGSKKSYTILFTTFVMIVVYTAVLGSVIIYLLKINQDIKTSQDQNNAKIKQIVQDLRELRLFVNNSRAWIHYFSNITLFRA